MNISAIGAFVIQVLEPFNLKPSETFFAVVFIDPGSDPASGSVNPKHPIFFPSASKGR